MSFIERCPLLGVSFIRYSMYTCHDCTADCMLVEEVSRDEFRDQIVAKPVSCSFSTPLAAHACVCPFHPFK